MNLRSALVRDFLVLAAYAAAVVGLVVGLDAAGAGVIAAERALPEVAARPMPQLLGLEQVEVAATDASPGFRAARAAPQDPSAPLALGGVAGGLALEDVAVALPAAAGVEVRGARGLWTADGLALADVTIAVDGVPRLRTGALRVVDGRLIGGAITVWLGPAPRRDVRGGLDLPIAGLRAALDAGPR